MPIIKLGEVEFSSERLGFPPGVAPTADQVGVKLAEALDERDELFKRTEALQTEVESLRANEELLIAVERDLILGDAVREFKIDAVELPLLREMWSVAPESVKNHLSKLRAKPHLTAEQGLKGDVGSPTDPESEVMAAAAAIMAADKAITKTDAIFQALANDQALSARYRERQVAGIRKS